MNKKTILIGLAVIAVTLVAYKIWKSKQTETTETNGQ